MTTPSRFRAPNASVVLVALALVAMLGFQVVSQQQGKARPTVVAALDLATVLEGLEERAKKEAELKVLAESLIGEDEARQVEIKDLQAQFEALAANAPDRIEMRDRVALAVIEHQEWQRFQYDRLDLDKSLMLRDLTESITKAVIRLAELEGYDLVVVDDSGQKISLNPDSGVSRETQVKQQMITRRIMYASPAIDITAQLIERMNNAFAAGT